MVNKLFVQMSSTAPVPTPQPNCTAKKIDNKPQSVLSANDKKKLESLMCDLDDGFRANHLIANNSSDVM